MPDKTPTTKKGKEQVVHSEMKKFKEGDLHSGSKEGPVVENPKQAIAISLAEAGESKPGWGSTPANTTPHKFDRPTSKPAHGWGHPAPVRSGHLRNSGHAGAHRVGGKRGR